MHNVILIFGAGHVVDELVQFRVPQLPAKSIYSVYISAVIITAYGCVVVSKEEHSGNAAFPLLKDLPFKKRM